MRTKFDLNISLEHNIFYAAPKNIETDIEYNYIINIHINNISNPIIKINVGDRKELAETILALMNVIIARK